jgi:RNA polymerase-binding transcription factor DksA
MPLDSEQKTELRRLLELRRETLAGEKEAGGPTESKKEGRHSKAAKKPARKKSAASAPASHELAEITGALKRLKEHEERFGYCERCFMEIPWGELAANPARRFCGRCS